MSYSGIIADVDGTLTPCPDEGGLWQYVGIGILLNELGRFHGRRARHLMRQFLDMRDLGERYKAGDIGYDEISRQYSAEVLDGTPSEVVERLISKYARRKKTRQSLDRRILFPIIEARYAGGKDTGILTTGCFSAKLEMLDAAGYGTAFAFGRGNHLEFDSGVCRGIALDIYGDKSPWFREMLDERSLRPEDVVYLGDSIKEDGPVFEIAGHTAVPPYATDKARQYFVKTFDSHVIESEEGFISWLGSL